MVGMSYPCSSDMNGQVCWFMSFMGVRVNIGRGCVLKL